MAHGCDTFHLASSGVVVNTFSLIPATDRNPLWDCIRKGVWCKTLLNQRNNNKSAVLGDVCDFLHLFFLFGGWKWAMDLNGLTQKLTVKKRTAHLEIIEAASWLTWASLVYCSVKSSFSLWISEIRLKVVPTIPLLHSTLILPTYATPSSHCYTFAVWLVRHSTNYSLYHPVQSAQLTPIACIVSWKKETFQNIFPPSEEQASRLLHRFLEYK